jgi:hypothetical protein
MIVNFIIICNKYNCDNDIYVTFELAWNNMKARFLFHFLTISTNRLFLLDHIVLLFPVQQCTRLVFNLSTGID